MTQVGGGGAPPPQANAASPFTYIGRPISLISKSQIRYEGILFTIDTNESTVALRNVRSFGTEGRNRPEGSVPPVNSVYDYVIFRGADILDLQVLNPVQFPQHPPPVQPYHDPAIVARSNVAPRVPPQQPATSSIPISQPQAPLSHAYPPPAPVPPAQNVAPQVPAALGSGVRQGSTPHMSQANGVAQASAPLTSTPQAAAAPPPPYSAPQQTNVSAPTGAQPSDAVTSRAPDVKLEPSKVPVSQPQAQPALRPLPPSSTGSTAVNTSAPQPALQPLQQTSKTGLRPLPQGVSAPPAAAAAVTNAKPALRPLQQPASGGSAPAQPPYKGWGPPPQLRTWGPPAAGGRKEQNARPVRRAPTANASGTAAAAAPPPAPGSTRRGGRGGRRKTRKGPGIEVPTEDFDFETMHTKFDKVSMEDQAEAIAGMPAIAEPYDKSRGFFDQLVPEKEMPRQRPNAAQRRAADIETFGEVGNVHSRNHRYRTSRGRRGGRNRSRNNNNQAPQAQAPPQQTN